MQSPNSICFLIYSISVRSRVWSVQDSEGKAVKEVTTVADIIYQTFQKHGIPMLAMDHHVLTPQTRTGTAADGSALPAPGFRYEVSCLSLGLGGG